MNIINTIKLLKESKWYLIIPLFTTAITLQINKIEINIFELIFNNFIFSSISIIIFIFIYLVLLGMIDNILFPIIFGITLLTFSFALLVIEVMNLDNIVIPYNINIFWYFALISLSFIIFELGINNKQT